jgi:RNA polymerase sigma factor (sigma-70 family)
MKGHGMQAYEAIVVQAAQGNVEAFGTLVERFQDMAVGYAYSILGDYGYAQDAAQEAFIQVYTNLSQLQEPAAFPGWFKKVVFSCCTRLLRRERKEVELDHILVEKLAGAPEHEPTWAFERKAWQMQIRAVIRSLPEEQRSVLILYYIKEFSYQEIADFLSLPVHTVTNRLHSAKKRVKKELWAMVEENIKAIQVSRDEKFKRRVLAEVPHVGFYTTGNVCPQDIALPGVLRAWLASQGEDYGYLPFHAHHREWKLDIAATCFAGVSGATFKFFWNPNQWKPTGWIDPAYMTVYGDRHIQRSMEAAGYAYELRLQPAFAARLPYSGKLLGSEAQTRRLIMESIDRGRPVIALGVVGPAEPCLVAGYDEEGAVLVGWNYFQGEPGTNTGVEFEPNGYFRKRDWYANTYGVLTIGKKQARPSLKTIYRQAIEWGVELLHRSEVAGFAAGWPSYEEWASVFLSDSPTPLVTVAGERPASPGLSYVECLSQTIWELAERRWYGARFIEGVLLKNAPDLPAEPLAAAARAFQVEHDLMWEIAFLSGIEGGDPAQNLADRETRQKIASAIQQAKAKDIEAAGDLERALSSPGW